MLLPGQILICSFYIRFFYKACGPERIHAFICIQVISLLDVAKACRRVGGLDAKRYQEILFGCHPGSFEDVQELLLVFNEVVSCDNRHDGLWVTF